MNTCPYSSVLVYFVINWLGMSENGGFFDIEAILPHVFVLLVGKMVKNGSKLAKIMVYLENPQNADLKKKLCLSLLYA